MLCIFALYVDVFAAGWISDGGDNWRYVSADDVYLASTIQSSGEDKYYLDENGYMVRDYLLENYNDAIYYFDEDGKMVKNTWVAIDQTQVYNQMDNPPSIYLYYFGANGKAYKSTDGIVKKTIDGKKYLFNEDGQMLSGWINEAGERYSDIDNNEDDPFNGFCYYAGDETDGVLREGWTAWEDGSTDDRYYKRDVLWFYFQPSNNKKYQSTDANTLLRKDINGKTYAFDDRGIMTEGWDAEAIDPNNEDVSVSANKYYEEEGLDSGRMAKKQWVFAVPSQKQNLDDYEAEIKRWFYVTGGGEATKDAMKKINGDYYAFDANGIMKTGLCVIEKSTKKYVDTIDTESTDGKDFVISRHYISNDTSSGSKIFNIFDDSTQNIFYFLPDETDTDNFGKRKTYKASVPFGDDDYDFISKRTGENEGYKDKAYYQNGIKLKADKGIGFGMVFAGYSDSASPSNVDYAPLYNTDQTTHPWAREDTNHPGIYSDYIVLKNADAAAIGKYPVFFVVDKSGNKIKSNNVVKKDKSNNYWAIGTNGALIGIYDVPIRYYKKLRKWQFKSDKSVEDKIKNTWINFGELDQYGKTCYAERDRQEAGGYAIVNLNESYATNFRFAD